MMGRQTSSSARIPGHRPDTPAVWVVYSTASEVHQDGMLAFAS